MDNLESRVSIVETHIDHIRGDLADIKRDVREIRPELTASRLDVASLRAKVETLPTKGFIVAVVSGWGVVIGAALLLLRLIGP